MFPNIININKLLIGNSFTFGNFIPYYESYLFYKNKKDITLLDLFYVCPTSTTVLNILPSITGFLDNILGIRILTIICTISLIISQLIIYFYMEYYLMIIAYIIYGFAGSITYLPTLKNCWKYFPEKKGLISGILFSSCGLSSFLFTSIGDYIINPDTLSENEDGLYPEEVSLRYLNYLKFYIISIIVLGTLSSILSFTFQEEMDIKEGEKLINDDEENINDKIHTENNDEKNNNNKEKEIIIKTDNNNEDNKSEEVSLKESLFSIEFLLCFIIVGCTLLFGFLLISTYKPFEILMNLDEFGMHTLSKAYTLLNTFSRIIWGLIYDKFGFKYPYIFVCVNQIICSSLLYFSAKNLITYFIVCCLGVLSFSGHVILFPNLINKKFGVDNSVILVGICGILGGITCFLGPVLTSQIIKDNSDYLKTYIITGSATVVSLVLTFVIKIEKMKKKIVLENN